MGRQISKIVVFFRAKIGKFALFTLFSCFYSTDMVLSVLSKRYFLVVALYIFYINSVLGVMKGGRTEKGCFLQLSYLEQLPFAVLTLYSGLVDMGCVL